MSASSNISAAVDLLVAHSGIDPVLPHSAPWENAMMRATVLSLNDRLLTSVTQLSEQRDHQSLATELVAGLQYIMGNASVDVFGLIHAKDDDTGENLRMIQNRLDPSEPPRSAADEPGINECCEENGILVIENSSGHPLRVLVPISNPLQTEGIVVINCDVFSDAERQCVVHLCKIYGNFDGLLETSEHDRLTGLLDRSAYDKSITEVIQSVQSSHRRCSDQGLSTCLAILDIDFFKNINDTWGHLYGDEVLVKIAQAMKHCFRTSDALFRYGGEEFVVLLKNIDIDNALLVLDRFRNDLANRHFPKIDQVTITIGVAQFDTGDTPDSIFSKADRSLYYAKNHGRNQVQAFEHLRKAGKVQVQHIESDDVEVWK